MTSSQVFRWSGLPTEHTERQTDTRCRWCWWCGVPLDHVGIVSAWWWSVHAPTPQPDRQDQVATPPDPTGVPKRVDDYTFPYVCNFLTLTPAVSAPAAAKLLQKCAVQRLSEGNSPLYAVKRTHEEEISVGLCSFLCNLSLFLSMLHLQAEFYGLPPRFIAQRRRVAVAKCFSRHPI